MAKQTRAPRKNIVKAEPLNETLTVTETVTETLEPIVNETPMEIVKEPLEELPRPVKVFWHKRCIDEKKTTKTTLKPHEVLTLTDGTVTIEEKLVPVYSLKRGKRIYYLIDVTPSDIVKAAQEKERRDTLKKNEEDAKEALKK